MDPITLGLMGSSAISGLAGVLGGNKQADAANAATAAQMSMYNQTRKDNMPWMQAGQGGLNALMSLYGLANVDGTYTRTPESAAAAMKFMQQDPSYQFRFNQGQGAIENGAAARGNFMSGNTLRALADYGQNMASTEFGNIANRFAGLAGVGQQQANYLGNAGMNTAGQIGNNLMNAGAARASGYASLANGINNGISNYAYLQGLKTQPKVV